MEKYYATYKCPICGQLIRYGEAKAMEPERMHELRRKIMLNTSNTASIRKAPMKIPHDCNNGSFGVAYFAGFEREEREVE